MRVGIEHLGILEQLVGVVGGHGKPSGVVDVEKGHAQVFFERVNSLGEALRRHGHAAGSGREVALHVGKLKVTKVFSVQAATPIKRRQRWLLPSPEGPTIVRDLRILRPVEGLNFSFHSNGCDPQKAVGGKNIAGWTDRMA